jgi:uncharacterized protein YgbK (DUF1537 family)
VVVLDDDPTGTQTVHDLWVLTNWSPQMLRAALGEQRRIFYVLTNSRSLSETAARQLNQQLAANLAAAASDLECELDVISRSDSTLRGHFPAEVDALTATLASSLGCTFDGTILCPFFLEGGRITVGNVHWVTEGERLVPASQTEFAQDTTFGYRASDLCAWVEEKSSGRIPREQVLPISIDTIRTDGPESVHRVLTKVRDGRVAIVNAVTYRDLAVFTAGLLRSETEGQRFLFRTAASFVRIRGGISERPLLTRQEMVRGSGTGGLVVVGSYVDKTTRQLQSAVSQCPDLVPLELSVRQALDPAARDAEVARVAQNANAALEHGQTPIVFTSRNLLTDYGRAGELEVGQEVSSALVSVVQGITTTPRFIIAKGGITSSDVAMRGLDVERAWVLGQIVPGVPVWRLGPESRFPQIPYVVFPGNVGDDHSLLKAIEILSCSG